MTLSDIERYFDYLKLFRSLTRRKIRRTFCDDLLTNGQKSYYFAGAQPLFQSWGVQFLGLDYCT